MKLIPSLILALGAVSAQAQTTIPFERTGCTNTRTCYDVENSQTNPSDRVTLYANPLSGSLSVVVNDAVYTGPGSNPGDVLQDITVYSADGAQAVVNATFEHSRVLVRSGHNYWVTRWTLTGGSVVLP